MDQRATLDVTVCAKCNNLVVEGVGRQQECMAPFVSQLLEIKAKLDSEAAKRQEESKQKNKL